MSSQSSENAAAKIDSPVQSWLILGLLVALFAGKFGLARLIDSPTPTSARSLIIPFVAVTAIFALGANAKSSRRPNASLNIFSWLHFTWLTVLLVSALGVSSNEYLGEYVSDIAWLAALSMLALVAGRQLTSENLTAIAFIVCAIGGIFLLGALASGPGAGGRYSAFGGGPNVFVRIMLLGFLGSLFLFSQRRKAFYALCAPAFLIGGVLSGSRGGFVTLAALVAILVLSRVGSLRRLMQLLLGASIMLGITFGIMSRVPGMEVWFRERFLNTLFGDSVYTSGRDSLFASGISMFQNAPIQGVGLSGFATQHEGSYPHNMMIETAAEAGLIGLIPLVLSLLVVSTSLVKYARFDESLFLYSSGILFLVASQFSGSYYDTRFAWFFFILALAWRPPAAREVGP